ncbi:hypothetical protein JTB14_024294 [Gonioctena quinquepunctata]|nr:hypothetical protein JTB14_024294 [Gonioctena quinquepunctata]
MNNGNSHNYGSSSSNDNNDRNCNSDSYGGNSNNNNNNDPNVTVITTAQGGKSRWMFTRVEIKIDRRAKHQPVIMVLTRISYGTANSGMNRGSSGYPYGSRMRRSNSYSKENENQCTSQCIFGHMELLDDDQIPSETLVIKWVQDHITDDDMKRITSLREIRKCFGKLSSSDNEDGCEYSKELSKCMNLELDD